MYGNIAAVFSVLKRRAFGHSLFLTPIKEGSWLNVISIQVFIYQPLYLRPLYVRCGAEDCRREVFLIFIYFSPEMLEAFWD